MRHWQLQWQARHYAQQKIEFDPISITFVQSCRQILSEANYVLACATNMFEDYHRLFCTNLRQNNDDCYGNMDYYLASCH